MQYFAAYFMTLSQLLLYEKNSSLTEIEKLGYKLSKRDVKYAEMSNLIN